MKIIENITFYLILILPFFLITGPFLPDFAISLSAIFFLVIFLNTKIKQNYNKTLIFFFFVINCYLVINSIFSQYTQNSLSASLFFFRFFIFLLCIYYLFFFFKSFKNLFFVSLITSFTILIIDSIFQYFVGYNLLGYSYDKSNHLERLSSFFGDEKILGNYITKLYPLLFFLLIYNTLLKNNHKLLIFYVITFLSLVIVILSGERTSLVIISLFIFCSIIFIKWQRSQRLIMLLIFFVTIIFMYFNNIQFYDRIKITLDKTHGILADKGLRIYTPTHQSYILSATKMFVDNKFFGVGPKNFRKYCNHDKYIITYKQRLELSGIDNFDDYNTETLNSNVSCSTHPHNMHVQLLSEVGLIGYLPILYFILYILKDLFFNFRNLSDGYRIFMFSNLIFLFPIFPSSNFFSNYNTLFIFINISFFMISHRNKYNQNYEWKKL